MILTEHTAQITAGEKDGSGAGSTGNTGLLPIMQGGSRCHELGGLPTVPGLPGETVSFRDGYTYIDGQKLDESYLPTQGITQCANTFAVPEGCIFVMGDNRTGSNDSRFLSQPYIPVDAIQGHMLAAISIGSQQSWQGVRWIG